MRMRSPRFTINPVLVQSRLPTTSTVTVLTGPVGLRVRRSPSPVSDTGTFGGAVGAITLLSTFSDAAGSRVFSGGGVGAITLLSTFSDAAGSGSLAGGESGGEAGFEAGGESGGPTSRAVS